jgi:hypothetical protein
MHTLFAPGAPEVTMSEPRRPEPGPLSMFGALTGTAVVIAVLVAGGVGLGYLLDQALSTPHIFTFLGLVAGVAAAVAATRSIVTRFFG